VFTQRTFIEAKKNHVPQKGLPAEQNTMFCSEPANGSEQQVSTVSSNVPSRARKGYHQKSGSPQIYIK
jgi:hypothetical protein